MVNIVQQLIDASKPDVRITLHPYALQATVQIEHDGNTIAEARLTPGQVAAYLANAGTYPIFRVQLTPDALSDIEVQEIAFYNVLSTMRSATKQHPELEKPQPKLQPVNCSDSDIVDAIGAARAAGNSKGVLVTVDGALWCTHPEGK